MQPIKKQRGENKASLLFCIMEPLSDTYGKGSVDDEKDGNKRLANAKIVRTWAGWMDASADGVPSLGTVDEIPGLYVACAFSRTRLWNCTGSRRAACQAYRDGQDRC